MSKITKTEEHRNLADAIKAELSIDSTNGVFSGGDQPEKTLFEKLLPETLPIEQVKAVHTYENNFVAGTARALAELSNNVMGTNKELLSATHTLSMYGKNTVTVTANRSGDLDVSVTNRSVDPSHGELKKVFHDFRAAVKEAEAS